MARPLSVQLYTVREQLAGDRDGVLRRLADIGYGAVEPFRPTADPKGFRQVVDDLGLIVSSVHAGGLLGATPEAVFEAAAVLGTDLVIVPGGFPDEGFTTRDGLDRTAETLNGLAAKAARFGQRLGYHNHWWEYEPIVDGRHGLEVLADLLEPAVFLEVDTYWAHVGGADVPASLKRLGDRVQELHVKDGPGVKGAPHTAVGHGTLLVPEILAAAPQAWRVVELDECAGDIFDALAASRSYLASLGEA